MNLYTPREQIKWKNQEKQSYTRPENGSMTTTRQFDQNFLPRWKTQRGVHCSTLKRHWQRSGSRKAIICPASISSTQKCLGWWCACDCDPADLVTPTFFFAFPWRISTSQEHFPIHFKKHPNLRPEGWIIEFAETSINTKGTMQFLWLIFMDNAGSLFGNGFVCCIEICLTTSTSTLATGFNFAMAIQPNNDTSAINWVREKHQFECHPKVFDMINFLSPWEELLCSCTYCTYIAHASGEEQLPLNAWTEFNLGENIVAHVKINFWQMADCDKMSSLHRREPGRSRTGFLINSEL